MFGSRWLSSPPFSLFRAPPTLGPQTQVDHPMVEPLALLTDAPSKHEQELLTLVQLVDHPMHGASSRCCQTICCIHVKEDEAGLVRVALSRGPEEGAHHGNH